MSLAVIVFLFLWLSLSIILQANLLLNFRYFGLPAAFPFWKKWDIFRITQPWIFFAIPPGRDLFLCYRDKSVDDRMTPWRLVRFSRPRLLVRWFWNPDHVRTKAVYDLCSALLLRTSSDLGKPQAAFFASTEYTAISAYIQSEPRNLLSYERQFIILTVRWEPAPVDFEVLFLSPFFPVDGI